MAIAFSTTASSWAALRWVIPAAHDHAAGNNAGDGGTIQNTVRDGIAITDTANTTLNGVKVLNAGTVAGDNAILLKHDNAGQMSVTMNTPRSATRPVPRPHRTMACTSTARREWNVQRNNDGRHHICRRERSRGRRRGCHSQRLRQHHERGRNRTLDQRPQFGCWHRQPHGHRYRHGRRCRYQ